jgi:hypothetical protein
MFMKGKFIIFVFLWLTTLPIFASDWVFMVLAANREVYWVNINNEGDIDYGSYLTENQQIHLKNRNYLILLHQTGKILEMSIDSGLYDVAQIEKKLITLSQTSPTEIYFTWGSSQDLANNRYYRPEALLFRCLGVHNPHLLLPEQSRTYQLNKLKILWEKYSKASGYKISITDTRDNLIKELVVQDTVFNVSLDELMLPGLDMLIFTIRPICGYNVYDCERMEFWILKNSEADIKNFEKQLKKYREQTISRFSDTKIQKLLLAVFYEKEGMVIEAMELYHYVYLIGRQSGFKTLYRHFLLRKGINNAYGKWAQH